MDRETTINTLSAIVLFILVVFFILWGLNLAGKVSCAMTANQMEFDYQYSIWVGCLIKVNDQWIPLQNYRVLE